MPTPDSQKSLQDHIDQAKIDHLLKPEHNYNDVDLGKSHVKENQLYGSFQSKQSSNEPISKSRTNPKSIPSLLSQNKISSKPRNMLNDTNNVRDFFQISDNDRCITDKKKLISTSYLKTNSKFRGVQQSGKSTYEVEVTLKTIDLASSFCSGFLKIKGLTEEYPEIATYFKGEIIGNERYSFITENKSWESSIENDLTHWKQLTNGVDPHLKELEDFSSKNFLNDQFVFMRWKEEFLVPDSTVKNINGASFEGFYYILLNQISGAISGLYYHRTSERFQQLHLSHCFDNGLNQSYAFS